eukprot:Sspe_Gene.78375::Locus_49029_Transcript_1_1_Confidence_1.000_Length_4205::g.78375::m.78375/K19671/WDR19, IFT144; WD repeat-containing protein 19
MRKLFTVDSNANGKGPVYFSWNKGGILLAICGVNHQLCILDRQGKAVDSRSLSHPGACIGIDWDSSGETVAVMQQGSNSIVLWHQAGKKLETLDTGLKDLTFLRWSKTGPHLAVGTAKGNLVLYNKRTLKKSLSMGKHNKRITCGTWSSNGRLALGGEDKVLTISNEDGDTLEQIPLKSEPSSLRFAEMKYEGKTAEQGENTISLNMGGKTLLLYNTVDQENPFELAFQAKYGSIVSYRWFGDGYVLIGFSSGTVVVISTRIQEIGNEVSSIRVHREHLNDITYCPALQKGASIGDSCIKIFDMEELQHMSEHRSDRFELENEFGNLMSCEWTEDGQILTVSSKSGNVHTFLTKIPILHDSYMNRVILLTSLRELCIRDVQTDSDIVRVPIDIEPSFVSLGPQHAAAGMNNCVWYYLYQPKPAQVARRTYVSTVDTVRMSTEYAAVLSDHKVTLHVIDQPDDAGYGYDQDERRQQRIFPEKDRDVLIMSVAMTNRFLIYGTNHGTVVYFSLEDRVLISEYRHTIGIRTLTPSPAGTRTAFIDDANEGYIFNPVDETVVKIDRFGVNTDKLMWDVEDWGVLVGCDAKVFTTYIYQPNTRWGAKCEPVTKTTDTSKVIVTTDRPAGFTPVVVVKGNMTCQMPGTGNMGSFTLQTHQHILNNRLVGDQQIRSAFDNALALGRLDTAWKYAQQLRLPECWYALGDQSLNLLDIEMAVRVYRQVNQPATVMALDKIRHVNEKNLLLGHVALLFKSFREAQTYFMKSSCPMLALEMRRNLMHWNEALELSEKLSPESIPYISREYATQLEFKGDYQPALDMFSKGLIEISPEMDNEAKVKSIQQHNEQCQAGIARITIRMGDISRGFNVAMQSESKSLATECAQIFEEMKQWNEAAQLHEKAGNYDKAVQIYISQTKNLKAAATLMKHIRSHKILTLYGAAKEREGLYEEAKQAYVKAENWDNVVRLLVENLNDISSAYEIVRRTKSADAAAIVAKQCRKDGNPESAIEFLLLAKKTDEAFELASQHDLMDTYARILGTNGSAEDNTNLAQYYEKKKQLGLAGDYYAKCNKYDKALSRYLQAATALENSPVRPEEMEANEKAREDLILKAIDVVGLSKSDTLVRQLVDYLTDDTNGKTTEPKLLFRLYMALGKFEKGGGMAMIMAARDQKMGKYRPAHTTLFQTYKTFEKHRITVPAELCRNLMLLHSYMIVKPLARVLQDHEASARMLVRTAKNINKFPEHIVPILTSCVTECHKVGMDRSAYDIAKQLVAPEYRNEIPEKHKKKIETIVRKPGHLSKRTYEGKKSEAMLIDPTEPTGPCPFCGNEVPMTMLDCPKCKSIIPYCIVTGQHMVLDDWSMCPNCQFPALYAPFHKLIGH